MGRSTDRRRLNDGPNRQDRMDGRRENALARPHEREINQHQAQLRPAEGHDAGEKASEQSSGWSGLNPLYRQQWK
jgi:hypothetical protein